MWRQALAAGMALAMVAAAFGQTDKEQEEAAKKKIIDFKKAVGKAKGEDELVAAIKALGETQHPKILREIAGYLKSASDAVKKEAIDQLSKYKKDKDVAEQLLAALVIEAGRAKKDKSGQDIGHEMAVKVLEALGEVASKPAAMKVHAYFKSPNVEIARSSIRSTGMIRSLDSVDPLIMLLQEMEQAAAGPQGAPPPPPPGTPNMPPGAMDSLRNEQMRRKQTLEPVIKDALTVITGESKKDAGEFSQWWNKNKAALRQKEKEQEEAEKKNK